MADFIIASSKQWHRDFFDRVASNNSGKWIYVSSPEELNNVLVGISKPRYLFFLHWNWKVPKDIWLEHECVCFHMTDVPHGRGGSPLQNLILEGKSETQVAALRMVEEMDAGPVYAKRPMSLQGRAEEIYLRAGELSWEMIDWIIKHQPTPTPQEGEPTFFKRRRPEQSVFPETGSLEYLHHFIRMLDAPTYPLAFLEHGDFRFEFSHAELSDDGVQAHVTIRLNNGSR